MILLLNLNLNAQAVWQSGASFGSGGSASSKATVNKPSGLAVGDLMIVSICYESGNTVTITATGWTLVRRDDRASEYGMIIYYKIAAANDVAANSFSFNFNASKKYSIGISRITGYDPANPIAASVGTSSTNQSSTVVAPSITTTAPNQLVMAYFSIKRKTTFSNGPGTERYDAAAEPPSHALYTYGQVTQGATGTKSATALQSDIWVAQQIGVNTLPLTKYYSRNGGGNWDDANSWSTAGHNGAPAACCPGESDSAIIGDNDTITLNVDVVCNAAITIDDTGTLLCSTRSISGIGSFNLNAGGRLGIGSPQGIGSSGSSGNIQVTGNREFSTEANYILDASANQLSGDGIPVIVNDLILVGNDSSATTIRKIVLGGDVNVTGTFEVQNNVHLQVKSNTLTLSGPINFEGGWISGTDNAGASTSNIVIDGSGPITGLAMFTNPSYFNDFYTNRDLTLGNNIFIRGDLTVDNANITFSDRTIGLYGNVNFIGTGRITSTSIASYLDIGGSGNDFSLPDLSLRQIQMNRSSSVTLTGTVNIAKRINLYQGSLLGGEFLNLAEFVLIDKTDGTLTGHYTPAGKVRVKYSSTREIIRTSDEVPLDPVKMDELEFNTANGMILNSNMYFFRKDPVIKGPVDVNGKSVRLNLGSFIFNSGAYFYGNSGELVYDFSTSFIALTGGVNLGGFGLTINSAKKAKEFILKRGFAAFNNVGGGQSINRYYEFNCPAAYNASMAATIVFSYSDEDLNGNDETTLKLYRSTDGGATWKLLSGTQVLNTVAKTITITGQSSIPPLLTAKGDQLSAARLNDGEDEGDKLSKNVENKQEGENEIQALLPTEAGVDQNYPNPFNPVTSVKFALPADDLVTLKVYDITGREIAELVNGFKPAGYHTVQFNGGNLSSGVYFYRITTGSGFNKVMKMTLIK